VKRREFITVLSGAAVAPIVWPTVADTQPLPVVGILNSGSPGELADLTAAFVQGLGETGYVEGRTAAIEYRWAEGQYDRLPALAADLVSRQVAVIFATSSASTVAAKAATAKIPIVFTMGGDAVQRGIVASLSRPGGNITGVNFFASTLGAKQLELLHELVPNVSMVAFLVNPKNSGASVQTNAAQEAARRLTQRPQVLTANTDAEVENAFAALVRERAGALLVGGDAFLTDRRHQIVALAARYAVPAVYPLREFAAIGGLMSYASSQTAAYRQAGVYAGRILKGETPADLPVQLPTKFELVINLKTAKALGIDIPPKLLALADEVIE
jgi:ABC-type uncharacterized transport system substrate-binding protein